MLGRQQWVLLGKMVRAVLLTAIVVGCVSAGVLYLLRAPLLAALSLGHTTSNTTTTLSDDESVDAPTMAARYLPAALLRVPPLLLLRASTSVLVGYGKMRLASAINGSLAVVDTAAFFIALRLLDYDLRDIGLVIASTCGVAALVATIALLLLPPVPKKVRVCCTCDLVPATTSRLPLRPIPHPPYLASRATASTSSYAPTPARLPPRPHLGGRTSRHHRIVRARRIASAMDAHVIRR